MARAPRPQSPSLRTFAHLAHMHPGTLDASAWNMLLNGFICRYWLCSDSSDRVRVEWHGGDRVVTSEAVMQTDCLHWLYDVPPEDVRELALAAVLDQGEYGVDGADFVGYETAKQIGDACDAWADVA